MKNRFEYLKEKCCNTKRNPYFIKLERLLLWKMFTYLCALLSQLKPSSILFYHSKSLFLSDYRFTTQLLMGKFYDITYFTS